MDELLFLPHRIPFPPNKGDKIRSWHILRALAERYVVHLGTFVDYADDVRHIPAVRQICGESLFVRIRPTWRRLLSCRAVLRARPLTESYYADGSMTAWVRELLRRRPIRAIVAFSSGMAQFCEVPEAVDVKRVLDLCDVDSDKWRQYAESAPFPFSAVYGYEHRRLAAAERRWSQTFDATLVISPQEQVLLEEPGQAASRVVCVRNGVDHAYFDPAREYANPFPPGVRAIVFTGAMDYWANVEGVEWFARDVLPAIRARAPDCRFVVVGSNPTARVLALQEHAGVQVTGTVPDVRPYLAAAHCVVVPLRISRGVQNKVLEAMAMARPVVATSASLAGISEGTTPGVAAADEAQTFGNRVLEQLARPQPAGINSVARRAVLERFDWGRNLEGLLALLNHGSTTRAAIGLETSSAVT
jgi:sugar transferase (PEP-CTERM/EpsH1 system associated)